MGFYVYGIMYRIEGSQIVFFQPSWNRETAGYRRRGQSVYHLPDGLWADGFPDFSRSFRWQFGVANCPNTLRYCFDHMKSTLFCGLFKRKNEVMSL